MSEVNDDHVILLLEKLSSKSKPPAVLTNVAKDYDPAFDTLERIAGKDWVAVEKEVWCHQSTITILNNEAFRYYLPSLLQWAWNELPSVELSFDALLLDLAGTYEISEVSNKAESMFNVAESESAEIIDKRNKKYHDLFSLQDMKILSQLVTLICKKWPNDCEYDECTEALSTLDKMICSRPD